MHPARLLSRTPRVLATGAALALMPLMTLPVWAQTPTDPVAAAAAEPGARVTASGLVFRELKAGSGTAPTGADTVRVHYRGTFPNGDEFDSSYKRGQPAVFPLGRVIKCWTEGLQLMKPGARARLTCPAAIAYGDRGAGNLIPPGAVLRFEVELLAVNP